MKLSMIATLGAAAGAAFVLLIQQFAETPEERHQRMITELQFILPVLRAMNGQAQLPSLDLFP